jgi:hypothetical protein
MTTEETNSIIKSFSNSLLEANRIASFLCAQWYPQSLLAYPKATIQQALERALVSSTLQGDPETGELLQASLGYLENFIDDEEAYHRNHIIMGKKSYWEALRQKN